MAEVASTRVAESCTAPGTGAFTVTGALTAHVGFNAVCSTSDTFDYHAVAVDGSGVPTGDWEEGIGTYSSANTVSRTTVLHSSNSNTTVNFSSGTVVVFMTPSADRAKAVPRGGSAGQLLRKGSSTDFDAGWSNTLTDPVIVGTAVEDVFTITDGASVDINPANGSIQLWTLGASRTPISPTNFLAGQSVTLMILDGTAYTITWTSVGVTWVGGTAPTLDTTKYTIVELWKVGSTIYGSSPGAA